MPKPDPAYFLWCDIETTGLDTTLDPPLEIATLITTPNLAEVEPVRRFHSIIRTSSWAEQRLAENDYVREMHTENGLLQELADGHGMDKADIEHAILAQLDTLPSDGPVFLAGTGVQAFDIRVIEAHWPFLHERLDYRTIDIGGMRRFLKYSMGVPEVWMPDEADESLHRSRGDVINALDQAKGMSSLLGEAFDTREFRLIHPELWGGPEE